MLTIPFPTGIFCREILFGIEISMEDGKSDQKKFESNRMTKIQGSKSNTLFDDDDDNFYN